MCSNKNILDKLSSMLENIEKDGNFTVEEYYLILTRSLIRVRSLEQKNKVLEAKLDQYELNDGMQGAVVSAIRDILNEQDVPKAAYIDDHVANAIVQRNISIDALKQQKKLWEELAEIKPDSQQTAWNELIRSAKHNANEIENTLVSLGGHKE